MQAKLYIPSSIKTQKNLVPFCLWEDCAVRAVLKISAILLKYAKTHGLRTPNEGINQKNLKIWADVAVKICFDRT